MRDIKSLRLCLLAVVLFCSNVLAGDILIADFEGDSYGSGWQVTGKAFGSGPAKAANWRVRGQQGKKLVYTYLGGDKLTGTLTSPEFTIQRNYIKFLIGGGNHPGKTCVNLIVDGKVLRTATGANHKRMSWVCWDVKQFSGKQAKIEMVDNCTGRWGNLTADSISQTNDKVWYDDIELVVKAEKKYLNIPVDNGTPEQVLVYVDGKIDYHFELQLADAGKEKYWVYMDLSRYKGKTIKLKMRRFSMYDKNALQRCYQSDVPRQAATFYKESKRPLFHFTTRRGWQNDANGLVYYNGWYHLFYQHYPYGWYASAGSMHWGHAISRDMVHWTEFDDALHPDIFGSVYSGSAVVDWKNTSGFKDGKNAPIVAIYTAAGDYAPVERKRTQVLAYSTDGGKTFTKYDNNPVLGHIVAYNRDPKVIWHEQTNRWVMILYMKGNEYCLFSSPNLKEWEKICDLTLKGVTECPDIFPLALDGDESNIKWVIWGANGTYVVGRFDGKSFTSETEPRKCYDGGTIYAGQTFSDIPASDGRRLHIAWLPTRSSGVFKDMPFNQQMVFPVEFKLKTTLNGPMIFAWPVKEIETLYRRGHNLKQHVCAGITDLSNCVGTNLLDIYAEFSVKGSSGTVGFEIRGKKFIYDIAKRQITANGYTAALEPVDGIVNMRLLIDVTTVEFFAGDGLVYIPSYLVAADDNSSIKVITNNKSADLKSLQVNELDSIWNKYAQGFTKK